jgi:hypothetical protein
MDEDLNPKIKVKGSNPHSCNLWCLGLVGTYQPINRPTLGILDR